MELKPTSHGKGYCSNARYKIGKEIYWEIRVLASQNWSMHVDHHKTLRCTFPQKVFWDIEFRNFLFISIQYDYIQSQILKKERITNLKEVIAFRINEESKQKRYGKTTNK